MSYQVLSRKYRPQIFDDVTGQQHVTRTLKNAIALDRVGHGYIFSGPRGVGKTTTARILAKALNCKSPVNNDPCDKCSICVEITEGRNIDVLEIDGASNRGIDDIRELRESAKYPPTVGKYRIYIIDEVHMLTREAFNALLKTLEEPPPFVIFIMATTDPHKIPPTILSRAQRFDFKRISVLGIIHRLEYILNAEKISYDEDCLKLIALKADGGLRDALSVLDQIIAYTDSGITMETVISVLGLVESSVYHRLLVNIFDNDASTILSNLDSLLNSGVAISDFISGFNEYFRNCLLVAAGQDTAYHLTEETLTWMKENQDKYHLTDFTRILDLSLKFERDLRYLRHPRIGLETLMMKLAAMDSTVLISHLLSGAPVPDPPRTPSSASRVSAVEKPRNEPPGQTGGESYSSEPPLKSTVSEPVKKNKTGDEELFGGETSLNNLLEKWDSVVSEFESMNMKIAHFLEDCRPVKFEHGRLVISVPTKSNGFKIKSLERDCEIIEAKFTSLMSSRVKIKFIAETSEKTEVKTLKQVQQEGFTDHPLFEKIYEEFNCEMIR